MKQTSPTSMRNVLYLHAMFVESEAWMWGEQRGVQIENTGGGTSVRRSNAPRKYHCPIVFACVRDVFARFARNEKEMLRSVFYLFLFKIRCLAACREWCCIAVAWGCYPTAFTFSDGLEGNTTASLHTNRPSVSVASDSLKNIWLICRIRSF